MTKLMKNRKKEKIAYKKEKVVLSDILPYEVPVIFSNRYFYRFLIENKIEFKSGKITWDKKNKKLTNIINSIFLSEKKDPTKNLPFEFKISHKNNSYRSLSIMHPINQIQTVAFYNEFTETIKYFAGVSQFSIRKPHKVAKSRFTNDYIHRQETDSENDSHIEIHKEKTENLKTFFSYEKYSNIHKFFESYEYQRNEKKFNYLYKFDISKCFDSIYTHSLPWALYNKNIVKDNIGKSKKTFAGKFDTLMQDMNYGETNGILIGSEVSRIFAELLLQQIDKNVFDELYEEKIIHEKNYVVFRYVDDYFLFHNDEIQRDKIFEKFTHHLKQYKLFINDAKSYQYSRPIITELTIAKTQIKDLINDHLNIKRINSESDAKNPKEQWKVNFKSSDIIVRIKIIIKEANIEYKDIINYSIAIIEAKTYTAIVELKNTDNKEIYIKMFISYILNILDLVFFIYSVAPRVSATIKVVSLVSKLLVFLKENGDFKKYQKELLYKKIFDEMYQIIKINVNKNYVQNETLYLLITLAELADNYHIESRSLKEYFCSEDMNYFTIVTLLFYIKDKGGYDDINQTIIDAAKDKFKNCNKDTLKRNTELIMLLLDLLSCPFIADENKKKLLSDFGIEKHQSNYINFRKEWFIKWKDFNLADEIERKKSQEVYG